MTALLDAASAWLVGGAVPMAVAGLAAWGIERAAGPRLSARTRETLWTAVLLAAWSPALLPARSVLPGVAGAAALLRGDDFVSARAAWPWVHAIGTLALLARLAIAGAVLRRAVRRDSRPAAPRAMRRVATLAARLGVGRAPEVRVVVGSALGAPAVHGLGRAVLLVPPRVDDCALLHELAHLARRDPLRALLTAGLVAACWWHPVAWIARRRLSVARELGSDALAVAALGGDHQRYRAALAAAARRALDTAPLHRVQLAFGGSALRERLRALQVAPPAHRPHRVAPLVAAVLLAAAASQLGDRAWPGRGTAARPSALPPDLPPVLRADLPLAGDGPGCLPLRFAVLQALGRERLLPSPDDPDEARR